MTKIHEGPRLCLEAIVAPHTPQTMLLTVFSDFDEMMGIRADLASNPSIRRHRSELESAGALEAVQSQVLIVDQQSLHFPSDPGVFKTGILEVRSYHAPTWHEGPPAQVNEAFHRAGIHSIVNGATAAGEHVPRFTFVIPFESLAAREQGWSRLDADREWIAMQRDWTSERGSAIAATSKSIYKLVPSSQLG